MYEISLITYCTTCKVRSQATVLKKALLEEQTKNLEIKELMKEQEQKIRKHTHEMESLTFRNEQLAKRITVLQQELQENSHGKKSKNKNPENNVHSTFSVLDEELHKKILENAELVSTVSKQLVICIIINKTIYLFALRWPIEN